MVLALNTVSGQVSDVSPKMLKHPHFSKYLVPVEDGRKPYNAEMYKPGTVEEKIEQSAKKSFFGLSKKENSEDNIDIEDEN
jgi:hypothetical protein